MMKHRGSHAEQFLYCAIHINLRLGNPLPPGWWDNSRNPFSTFSFYVSLNILMTALELLICTAWESAISKTVRYLIQLQLSKSLL